MAEMKDAHIVEIPVDEEHQQKQLITAMQHHPLAEISRSPGHLLLLKLWQREEDLCSRRIARKESRLDSIKQDIFHLCCFFLLFHALFTVLVFTSSVSEAPTCGKWYWKVWSQLSRERADGRSITRCIQELRMKGSSFDLSKEPLQSGKKLKSSSVEVWPSQFPSCSFARCDADRKTDLCRLRPGARARAHTDPLDCSPISLVQVMKPTGFTCPQRG